MTPETGIDQNPDKPGFGKVGLHCAVCGGRRLKVLYTRGKPQKIMRRRECRGCGNRITTWERVPGQC